MNGSLRIALIVLCAMGLTACATTKVTTAWRAPGEGPVAFTDVLALAISDDQALRRVAEEEICRQVAPVECTPAFSIIPEGETLNIEQAKAKVKAEGFDGATVFRVIGEKERVTYVPPTYGPTFWGYYGRAWPATYSPGYQRTDKLVRVETSVYSVQSDKLIWVGTTETMNPKSVPDLVDDVAKAVAADMRKHGLLAARS